MCHRPEGRAPGPPYRAAVRTHGRVEIVSADGSHVPAYGAIPVEPRRGCAVLLPDVRGLHPFYEDLAYRFAEAGFTTLAVDLYGRTARDDMRGDEFAWRDHVDQVRAEQVDADVRAALTYLRSYDRGPAFTVGFCFGGGHSWRLADSTLALAATIGFYGLPHLVTGVPAPDRAPMLMLLAGQDEETPSWAFEELMARLDVANVPYEAHTYAEAPHSFFDRSHDQWADACRDAWQRIFAFTDRHRSRADCSTEPTRRDL